MRRILHLSCSTALCLALACGGDRDGSSQQPAPASPPAPTARTASETDGPAKPTDPSQTDTPSPPSDDRTPAAHAEVPALTLAPVSADARRRGDELNRQGLALHRKRELAAAIASYRQAIAADPSHRFARYNLASALVTHGQRDAALDLLDDFRTPGCAQCLERLRRAPQDGEWRPLWTDPRFLQITAAGDQDAAGRPVARVVAFALSLPEDRADKQAFEAEVSLEPTPGWVRAPTLTWRLAVAGKVQVEHELTAAEVTSGWVGQQFATPTQPFSITLLVDGRPFGTLSAKPGDIKPGLYPYPIVRPASHPENVGRCHGTECPRFPAISPDGRYLATRDQYEVMDRDARCGPPSVPLTRYEVLGEDRSLGSRKLDGWLPMSCDVIDRLPDGFTVDVDLFESRVTIADAIGRDVAQQEIEASTYDICAADGLRTVVIRLGDGLDGDCDSVPSYRYVALSY